MSEGGKRWLADRREGIKADWLRPVPCPVFPSPVSTYPRRSDWQKCFEGSKKGKKKPRSQNSTFFLSENWNVWSYERESAHKMSTVEKLRQETWGKGTVSGSTGETGPQMRLWDLSAFGSSELPVSESVSNSERERGLLTTHTSPPTASWRPTWRPGSVSWCPQSPCTLRV